MNKEVEEIVGNGKLTGSVHKETLAVSDTIRISMQNRHSRAPSPGSCTQQSVKNASRTRSLGGRSPRKWLDCRARITSKELAPLHSVEIGILRNAGSTSPQMDANLGISVLTHTVRLTNSLAKGF